jgi:hypothetical protein
LIALPDTSLKRFVELKPSQCGPLKIAIKNGHTFLTILIGTLLGSTLTTIKKAHPTLPISNSIILNLSKSKSCLTIYLHISTITLYFPIYFHPPTASNAIFLTLHLTGIPVPTITN